MKIIHMNESDLKKKKKRIYNVKTYYKLPILGYVLDVRIFVYICSAN